MTVSAKDIETLVKLTGKFENDGDPYAGVSGDFDGQGISCGVLQWNIGQASLGKLVQGVGLPHVLATMPVFGQELWTACKPPIAEGLRIVRSWQTGDKIKPKPKAELIALMRSAPMKTQQDKYIRVVADIADREAEKWAKARGASARTAQELAWFFDVLTQNGGLGKLSYKDVKAFKVAAAPGKPNDLVCNWLARANPDLPGFGDGKKNAALWRTVAGELSMDLLILSYLRALAAKQKWRIDTLNRKGTIATKLGWVHKSKIDLASTFP